MATTRATYQVPIDADDRCTFDHPALVQDERHQYHVIAIPASDPTSQLITFGGSIESIAPPQPPVIDPPTPEAGGDTGIDVEAGAGQGMVVDFDVAPALGAAIAGTLAASVGARSTAASAAVVHRPGRLDQPRSRWRDPDPRGAVPPRARFRTSRPR